MVGLRLLGLGMQLMGLLWKIGLLILSEIGLGTCNVFLDFSETIRNRIQVIVERFRTGVSTGFERSRSLFQRLFRCVAVKRCRVARKQI